MLKSEKTSEMEKPKFLAKSIMIYELPIDFTFDPIKSIIKIQDEYQTFEQWLAKKYKNSSVTRQNYVSVKPSWTIVLRDLEPQFATSTIDELFKKLKQIVAASFPFTKDELSSDEVMKASKRLGLNLRVEGDNWFIDAIGALEDANERLELFRSFVKEHHAREQKVE